MDIHKPDFWLYCSCGSNFTRSDSLKRHRLKWSAINNNFDTSDDEDLNVHSNNKVEPEVCKPLDLIETLNNTTPIANANSEYNNQIKDVVTSKPPSDTYVLVSKKVTPNVLEIKKFCDNNDLASDSESPITHPHLSK